MDERLENIAAGHFQAWGATEKGKHVVGLARMVGLDLLPVMAYGPGFEAGYSLGQVVQEARELNVLGLRKAIEAWRAEAEGSNQDGDDERGRALIACAAQVEEIIQVAEVLRTLPELVPA